eukprot:352864-Chlamydomonas_euryale.AAC.1
MSPAVFSTHNITNTRPFGLIQWFFRAAVHSTQDFTQAEMLIDMCVVVDPNSLFYAGDTAQTIMRGIGFRFADIRTLFFHEAARRRAAGGAAARVPIAVPAIDQLCVNYRTHQGILDCAALLVDLLKEFFPQVWNRMRGGAISVDC